MKLGVVADTQGRYDVNALLRVLGEKFAGVDGIWFAGDWEYAEVLEGLEPLADLVVCNGNAPDDPRRPERVEQVLEGHRIGMTHRLSPASREWARSLDLFIYAHSHQYHDEVIGATRYLNPGTATQPRFGSTEKTVALVELRPGTIDITRIDL